MEEEYVDLNLYVVEYFQLVIYGEIDKMVEKWGDLIEGI